MNNLSAQSRELGLHRVLDEPKVMPQNALKLDSQSPLAPNEVKLAVEILQIDAASFAQLKTVCPDEASFKSHVMEIVAGRGKMQNPVTGSGGMLLGRIVEIGSDYPDKKLVVGQKVATLVSLTATPLKLTRIDCVDFGKERVFVTGEAILFERSLYAVMPSDLSEGVALASFDICGAPLLTVNHVKAGDTVFLLGLGKAGKSVLAGVRRRFANKVRVLCADASASAVAYAKAADAGFSGASSVLNARDPIAVADWVRAQNNGKLADVTVNLVNVSNTELPAILATEDGGRCLFFSMATDFQKATLGAEAAGKDVQLIMGSGYVKGHADFMLELVRNDKNLRDYFEKEFG